jgi:hypothetical protein
MSYSSQTLLKHRLGLNHRTGRSSAGKGNVGNINHRLPYCSRIATRKVKVKWKRASVNLNMLMGQVSIFRSTEAVLVQSLVSFGLCSSESLLMFHSRCGYSSMVVGFIRKSTETDTLRDLSLDCRPSVDAVVISGESQQLIASPEQIGAVACLDAATIRGCD